MTLAKPKRFDFVSTVTDHGWFQLAPWLWQVEGCVLERVEHLSSGKVVLLKVTDGERNLQIECDVSLSPAEQNYIRNAIARSLRIDQDFEPFYTAAQARSDDSLWQNVKQGRGRLMRAPTLFEDVIKMICTTNITWSQTIQMSQRLCHVLGSPLPSNPTQKGFPTPAQVAGASSAVFEKQVRLGYRNGAVQHLAKEIMAGNLNLEALNNTVLRGDDLRKELQKLKGVGPYAAAGLAGLLGDYTHLPIDSVYREHVRNKYFAGDKSVPDKRLAAVYADWGEWQQLAYWFDKR